MTYYPPTAPGYVYPPQPQPTYVVAPPPRPIIYQTSGGAASSSTFSSTQKVTKVKKYSGPPSVTNKRGNTFNLNITRANKPTDSLKTKKPKDGKSLTKMKKPKDSLKTKKPKDGKSLTKMKKPKDSLKTKKPKTGKSLTKKKPKEGKGSLLKKAKKPKVGGSKKTKKPKTHGSSKPKKRLRIRKPKGSIKERIGVKLKVSVADKHVLRSFMDELQRVSSVASDGMLHTIKHAMFGLVRANEGKLPNMSDVSMEVAFMMLRALHSRSRRDMKLTFTNERNDEFTSLPTTPTAVNERTASAIFTMPDGTSTTLDGTYTITITFGTQTFTHVGFSMVNAKLFRDASRPTFELMVNLWDPSYMSAYYKYMVPIPVVVLTMTRSPTDERTYFISKATLAVDFNPRKHLVSLPVQSSDIIALPQITAPTYEPFKAYIINNVSMHRLIHSVLTEKLREKFAGSNNKWAFRCSGGDADGSVDHRVFLGAVVEAAIAYAIMAMLKEKGALEMVNDPEFIKQVLSVDENGSKAVAVVRSLYDAYHSSRGKTRTDAHQDFPSLLQLLTRTSGLPSSRNISCDQVRAYYDTVIGAMTGTADVSPVTLSYDAKEQMVLDNFALAPGADNDAAVSVGASGNTMELFLLAMFVRRYAERMAKTGKTPAEIINSYLTPKEFSIDWGVSFVDNTPVSYVVDPLVFSSCSTSTFSGLAAHARALTDELAQPSRLESIFYRMMAERFPVVGEDSSVAHSVGWMQRRVNKKLDVLFVGDDNGNMDNVVMVIVPQLHFFGVFHEMSADFSKPLETSYLDFVDMLVELLKSPVLVEQYGGIPDRTVLDVSPPSRANKSWDTSFIAQLPADFSVGLKLPDFSVEFVDPFVTPVQQTLRTVKFERIDKSGVNAQLVFSDGDIVLLVFDPRRNGYFTRLFEDADSLLGDEAVITETYIQYRGQIFVRRAEFDEFNRRYVDAYDRSTQAASVDVFNSKTTQNFKQGMLRAVTPVAAFSLEVAAPIGHRYGRRGVGGAFLGGALAGAALGSLAWSRPAPVYYPNYGYYPAPVVAPYGVAPVPVAAPGYFYRRRRRRRPLVVV